MLLEDRTHFFGEPSIGDRIYVRESYRQLIKLLFENFEAGDRGVIVSGNPGANISPMILIFSHFVS